MQQPTTAADRAKLAAATGAAGFVENGMKLGLGTGSTAAWLVRLLGERAKEGLSLTCVPTSTRTADLARDCGLTVTTLDAVGGLDLTIDGADEFDPDLNLIKGGGGALLQEKIVAAASARMVVIADEGKRKAVLGAFPLPVEVVRFGAETTAAAVARTLERLEVAGAKQSFRMDRAERYVTDEGHYILDLHLKRIGDPHRLSRRLLALPGVVETGLFLGMAEAVVLGREDGSHEVVRAENWGESLFEGLS